MKGLLLTYLLGYGGAAVAIFFPVIGLFIYAGFSVVRPQMIFGWAGDLTGMSFYVGVAMLIGWALKGFGNWQFGRAKPLVVLLLCYFGWYCLSAAFAPNSDLAWTMVKERSKVVLPFMVGMTMLDTPVLVRRFAWLVVLGHGYLGYEMNITYLQGYNKAADGLLGDNNSLAISMVAALGPAVFLGFSARQWWLRGLAFASAALIMHTVLLTFSRGGMLAMLITGAVVLVVMPKRPGYLAALVVVAALAVRFTGPQLEARFMTTFASPEERDGSAQSRLELWRDCLTVMQAHPVLGVGPAHWPSIAAEFGWPPGKQAHSTWMQLGAETGVASLIFLFSFYMLAALWGLRLARANKNSEMGVYGLYAFSGLVGFIIAAQFVSMEALEVPFYIVLVLGAALRLQALGEPAAAPAAAPHAPSFLEQPAWQGPARP